MFILLSLVNMQVFEKLHRHCVSLMNSFKKLKSLSKIASINLTIHIWILVHQSGRRKLLLITHFFCYHRVSQTDSCQNAFFCI